MPEDIIAALEAVDWKSKLGEFSGVLISGIGNIAGVILNIVSSVFDGVITALIGIIFSIYLLLGKDRLKKQSIRVMDRYIPSQKNTAIRRVLFILDDCFRRYIIGQCTEAVILGLLCAIGMLLLGLPYAPMISSLIAL